MPRLMRPLSKQETRTMTPVTRQGKTWFFAGSTGETYQLTPHRTFVGSNQVPDPDDVYQIECSCKSFEHGYFKTAGECKHGSELRYLHDSELLKQLEVPPNDDEFIIVIDDEIEGGSDTW